MKCKHEHTRTDESSVRCFTSSVAVHPYTEENPAAHGCITEIEQCLDCGHERPVNANQGHHEVGTWGLSRAELAERAEGQRRKNVLAQGRAMLRADKVRVLSVGAAAVILEVNGGRQRVWLGDIQDAAAQPDNGDGLVPYYTALLLKIREAKAA